MVALWLLVSHPMKSITCDVCGIKTSQEKAMKNWDIDINRKTVVKCTICSARDSGAIEVA